MAKRFQFRLLTLLAFTLCLHLSIVGAVMVWQHYHPKPTGLYDIELPDEVDDVVIGYYSREARSAKQSARSAKQSAR